MELTFKNNFVIDEEVKDISVVGHLKCSCGSEEFNIFHTGKQTKGILAPHIQKKDKQILVEAILSDCGKKIQIYDSSFDGENPKDISHPESNKLLIKGNDKFKLKICLNYNKGNYLTNKFFTIYIYGIGGKKDIVIYEE